MIFRIIAGEFFCVMGNYVISYHTKTLRTDMQCNRALVLCVVYDNKGYVIL